jgi:hypothetical protein
MPQPYLRVYFGPEDCDDQTIIPGSTESRPKLTVQLGEILPALADAVNTRRTWVHDFADDPVVISTDLYEVLLAYQELRPTG